MWSFHNTNQIFLLLEDIQHASQFLGSVFKSHFTFGENWLFKKILATLSKNLIGWTKSARIGSPTTLNRWYRLKMEEWCVVDIHCPILFVCVLICGMHRINSTITCCGIHSLSSKGHADCNPTRQSCLFKDDECCITLAFQVKLHAKWGTGPVPRRTSTLSMAPVCWLAGLSSAQQCGHT